MSRVTGRQYTRLLEFRTELRRFLRWSADQAKAAGLTPAQHQLLLAIKGHAGGSPTIGEIADYLLLRHHSTVELVDRAEQAGLIQRVPDADDARFVRATLTETGEAKLSELTGMALEELRRLGPVLAALHESET